MLKKILIFVIAVILLFSICSCGFLKEQKEDSQKEEKISVEDIEAGFSYLDPKIDISLLITNPGWRYQKDEDAGMVIFYKPDDYDGLSSFAISSNTDRQTSMSDKQLGDVIDQMGDESKTIVEGFVTSVDWKELDSVEAGGYIARRLSYTGILTSSGENVCGDYIFWWTKDKLYTCSFISFEEVYEDYFRILKQSLTSFKTYDELS